MLTSLRKIFLNCMSRLHCQHLRYDIDQYLKSVDAEMDSTTQKNGITTQENSGSTQETSKSTQEMILDEIRTHPFTTRQQLAKVIGITPDGIKKQLEKLRKANRIKHVGPTKGGHWEIIK